MTNTDKILAEFRDIFLKDESSLGLRYLMTNGAIKKFELEKIEAFLTSKILQALAEDRDRMRGEIERSKFRSTKAYARKKVDEAFMDAKEIRAYNKALDDLKPIISKLLK